MKFDLKPLLALIPMVLLLVSSIPVFVKSNSMLKVINISSSQQLLVLDIAAVGRDISRDSNSGLYLRLKKDLNLFKINHEFLSSKKLSSFSSSINDVYGLEHNLNNKVHHFISMVDKSIKEKTALNIPFDIIDPIIDSMKIISEIASYKNKSDNRLYGEIFAFIYIVMTFSLWSSWRKGVRDIRKFKKNNSRLKLDSIVFNHSSEGIITTNGSGKILSVSDKTEQLTGYSIGSIKGKNLSEFIDSITLDRKISTEMLIDAATLGLWRGEIRLSSRNDSSLSVGARAVFNEKSEITNYIIMLSDISEQKKVEEEFRYMSFHDQLTGLFNRSAMYHEFSMIKKIAKRDGISISVLTLDLDGFKSVNDTHGHNAGDHVLKTISENIKSSIRDTDSLIRLGGDEFAVISLFDKSKDDVSILSQKIIDSVSLPIDWQGGSLDVGVSIGGVISNDKGSQTLDSLLMLADAQMYKVKNSGKNNYSIS